MRRSGCHISPLLGDSQLKDQCLFRQLTKCQRLFLQSDDPEPRNDRIECTSGDHGRLVGNILVQKTRTKQVEQALQSATLELNRLHDESNRAIMAAQEITKVREDPNSMKGIVHYEEKSGRG